MNESEKYISYIYIWTKTSMEKVYCGQLGVGPLTIYVTLGNFLNIWDKRKISWVSWVSAVLWAEALVDFVLDGLFMEVCTANSLGRERPYLPLEQRKGLLTDYCKRSRFLNLEFLICDRTHWVYRTNLSHSAESLWDLVDKEQK